jgi:hypothetical protein
MYVTHLLSVFLCFLLLPSSFFFFPLLSFSSLFSHCYFQRWTGIIYRGVRLRFLKAVDRKGFDAVMGTIGSDVPAHAMWRFTNSITDMEAALLKAKSSDLQYDAPLVLFRFRFFFFFAYSRRAFHFSIFLLFSFFYLV